MKTDVELDNVMRINGLLEMIIDTAKELRIRDYPDLPETYIRDILFKMIYDLDMNVEYKLKLLKKIDRLLFINRSNR